MALEIGAAVLRAAVPSLGKLLKYEWGLDKTVKDGLKNLQDELMSMHAFLGDVSGMLPDLELGSQVKLQVHQARELSHAIETRLHSFMARIESTKGSLLSGPSKLVINHEIASYTKDTRNKVKEVRKRHGPYPCKSSLESTSTRQVDPRMFAMYTRDKESDPIGIDGAIAELTQKLSKGNHVSIVGMGGMGKTTLARAVYDKMKGGFDCEAFVPIGLRADMKKVLMDIFDELHIEIHGHAPDQGQLASQLQNFLVDKRCLFVIDDIWDMETWNLVECVFKGSAGSKIITTSRNLKIAEGAGGAVFMVKPLSPDDSKELLRAKAEAKCNDTDFDIESDKFLPKCGGVPMAITMIGRVLAKNHRKEWNRVYHSIGFDEHKQDGAFEHVRKVMCYSYADLPYNMKNCLLYLSLFPDDRWIEKNMLIWRWVAEGLVPDGLFEVGETYFNELLDRCMIQWAVSPRDVGQGGCRVHSLMLDLIRDLSSGEKENFSTVLRMKQESPCPVPVPCPSQTIHRLAIHDGQNQNTSLKLEVGEVLSFYASTCTGSSFPALRKFKRMRVIDLESCDISGEDCKLKHLGKLDGLGYIGLVCTPVAELPRKIGRLKLLQILDVWATGISELAPFIEDLRNLRCLRAGKGTRMMGRIGELTSLEELWLHSADKSPDLAMELRKLTKMRVLVIHFDEMDEDMQEALVLSLHQLKKLQVLQIWSDAEEKVRLGCWEGSVPSLELRQLLLFGVVLPRPMPWIHKSCVPKLSKLLLQVETLEAHDMEILGQMPSLRSLYLHSEEDKYRLSYTAGRDEFQVLEFLNTNIELICGAGALAVIQELEVWGIRVGMDVGLRGNMPLLERATYYLDCMCCGPAEVQNAEEELTHASREHPNRPTISIKRWNNLRVESEHVSREIGRVLKDPLDAGSNPDVGKILLDSMTRLSYYGAYDTTSPCQKPSLKTEFSTDDITAALNSQSVAKQMSDIVGETGCDPAVLKDMMKKLMQKPEYIGWVNNTMRNGDGGSLSVSDISGLVQLMMPDMITDYFEQIIEVSSGTLPPNVAIKRMFDGLAAYTQEHCCGQTCKVDANSLLASFDSMIANWRLPVDAAHIRKIMEKCVQNPEIVTSVTSIARNADGPFSASDYSRLLKLIMPEFLAEIKDMTGKGQGADSDTNLAGKHPAENSGAGINCQPPKVDEDSMLCWLNSPDGATFSCRQATLLGVGHVAYARILEKCLRNPKMIASMSSAEWNGDFSDMTSCLTNNTVMVELMLPDLMVYWQGRYMDRADTTSSSMALGVGAPLPESAQDGDNVSMMRMQVLPGVEQALAAGASSGQPSSSQGFLVDINSSIANNETSAAVAACTMNAAEKCMQNPEFAACLKPGSCSDSSRLVKLVPQEIASFMAKESDGSGKGQGADADSNLAGNDGAGPSREPPEFDIDSILSCLNTPEISALSSMVGMGPVVLTRIFVKCMRNLEMVATMSCPDISEHTFVTVLVKLMLTEVMDLDEEGTGTGE